MLRRLPLLLAAVAVMLAVWPVKADRIRYDLEAQSGGQAIAQLQARWADPVQRPFLQARPTCGLPLLAPWTYTQNSALRGGCAGPNSRSMSLAALALSLGFYAAYRQHSSAREGAPTGV